jgi:hypothetical protein
VSLVERGHLDRVSLSTLRRHAAVLDIRVDILARWRGGELDRLLNARHSALHETVASHILAVPGWQLAPEASFSIAGERGVIDILAFHEPTRSLLVIELKTAIVDVNELIGNVDRKRRLAKRVAAARGWDATSTSCWVIVEPGRTNARRIAAHRTMLRAAFPVGGPAAMAWLRDPAGSVAALSMWPSATPGSTGPVPRQRVPRPAGDAKGR